MVCIFGTEVRNGGRRKRLGKHKVGTVVKIHVAGVPTTLSNLSVQVIITVLRQIRRYL